MLDGPAGRTTARGITQTAPGATMAAGAAKKTNKGRRKPKKAGTTQKPQKTQSADGFINVAVTRATRQGLHLLKDAMGVQGQAEVIERLVAIGLAIHIVAR
jgi:hypothetical protein